MAENLGFSEASCPSELSNEATLSNGGRLTNEQLGPFAHFTNLVAKSEAVDVESDDEDGEQGNVTEYSLENNQVVELKHEAVDSESSDCENGLTIEFFNKSLPSTSFPIPDYNPPDHYASSSGSVNSLMETNYDGMDDKEWSLSDEQMDTDDDELEGASGPDPDYDNSEDNDTDDSDYKPKKRRKSKSSSVAKGRGSGRGVSKKYKRDSYQDKINRLKKSIAETDYMKVLPSTSSDVSCLQRLLAKGETTLTKKILAKKCQGKNKDMDVSEESQDEMRRSVEEVLKKRNLLPSWFGPEISHASITSYANILGMENIKGDSKSLDKPQTVGSQSASQLLQSLSQSITCKEKTKANNIPNVPTVMKSRDKMEGLSGRSCVLLQHLLLNDGRKKQVPDQVTPSSSSILAAAQELQSAGISVLRSMLTTGKNIFQKEPERTIPTVKPTLLRNLLEAAPAPLLPLGDKLGAVSEMTDSEEDRSADQENEEPESFGGYTVYVDNAVAEEDSKDSIASEHHDSLSMSMDTYVSRIKGTIKPEHLSELSSVSENSEVVNSEIMLNIKCEPLSPCAEGHESWNSKEVPLSTSVQPETDAQNAVKIKQEPKSPTSYCYDDGVDNKTEKDNKSQQSNHGNCRPTISGCVQPESQQSQGSSDEYGNIPIKSEPLSPKGDSGSDLIGILKPQTESNLRTLLVGNNIAPSPSFWSEGRPCMRETLSHKINHLKKEMNSDNRASVLDKSASACLQSLSRSGESVRSVLDKSASASLQSLSRSGESVRSLLDKSASASLHSLSRSGESVRSLLDKSASAHLQSLSRSSSKDTILRGMMDGSSTSVLGLDSPGEGHSYNTRRKKKQEDTSLLEKALKLFKPVLPAVKNRQSPDLYQKEASPVRIVQANQTGFGVQTGKTINMDTSGRVETENTDSNRALPFTQNASCSQQLLNIIKNVGASQKTSDSKEKGVTILKSMLNDDSVGRASVTKSSNIDNSESENPRPKIPRLTGNLKAQLQGISVPPNLISRRSGSFLSQNLESRSSPGVPHSYMETAATGASIFSPQSTAVSGSQMLGLSGRAASVSSQANHESSARNLVTDCPYQCRLCGSTFSSTSLLEEHMQIHFGSLPFGCSLCSKSFMTGKELEEHMKVHMGNLSPALVYKCTVCGAVFDTEMQHDQHRILHVVSLKTKFKCGECGKLFASEEVRDAHLKTHQYKSKTCELCGQQFKSESKYNLHKSVMHKSQGHPCEYCGEVFYCQSKYIRHLSQHTGLKEFRCEKCDKGFVSKNGVMGHIAKCQGRAYVCTGCEESFIRKMDLTSHIVDVHGHPGVRCEYCHKVFCYRSQLEEHQKEHEKELQWFQLETNSPQSSKDVSSRDDSDSCGTSHKDLEADLQQTQQEAEHPHSSNEVSKRDDRDSLGTQNNITYSVHRATGPAGVSEFSVQCLSEPTDDFEVVAISDSD